jgi:hypothetical protein
MLQTSAGRMVFGKYDGDSCMTVFRVIVAAGKGQRMEEFRTARIDRESSHVAVERAEGGSAPCERIVENASCFSPVKRKHFLEE